MRKRKDQKPETAREEEQTAAEQAPATETQAGDGEASANAAAAAADPAEEAETETAEAAWQREQAEQAEQIAKLKDSYLRLMAEYENFRKRTRSEKEALYDQSVADVVTLWLPVLDNLARARAACAVVSGSDVEAVVSGLALVERQVEDVLARLGVERIEALGQPFDPEQHEAVLHVEDEERAANEVAEVLQEGYRRGERVIRFATVKVAN